MSSISFFFSLSLFFQLKFIIYKADQIGAVIDFKEEFGLHDVIILGGAEAAILADQIAQAGKFYILLNLNYIKLFIFINKLFINNKNINL